MTHKSLKEGLGTDMAKSQYTVETLAVARTSEGEAHAVKNPFGAVIAWVYECDGRSAYNNAVFIANLINNAYGYTPFLNGENSNANS